MYYDSYINLQYYFILKHDGFSSEYDSLSMVLG